jgi:hypothetical protein
VPLGPIADGLFSLVIAIAEGVARAIAGAIRVTDPKVERTIQLLVYLFIVCPLLLLAVATIVAGTRWLIQFAGMGAPYA